MAKDKTLDLSKKELAAKAAAKTTAARTGKPKKSIIKYFKDARSEFKKVVWPSRKQVVNNTIVVIISLIVSGIAIWGLDTLFGWLLMLLIGK